MSQTPVEARTARSLSESGPGPAAEEKPAEAAPAAEEKPAEAAPAAEEKSAEAAPAAEEASEPGAGDEPPPHGPIAELLDRERGEERGTSTRGGGVTNKLNK